MRSVNVDGRAYRHRRDRIRFIRPLKIEALEARCVLSFGGIDLNVGLTGFEPTIAVNPTNPNNVIVAQNNFGTPTLKISNDGGATFPISRNALLPAGDTSFNGDDSLAFDAQSRLFWTYLASPGKDVVSLQVNPTTGAVIGSASYVAQGNLDKEWIAADRNPSSPFANNLYVVWHDLANSTFPVRFSRSTNQGASWTTIGSNLAGANEGTTWPSEVAVASSGDVWVAWPTNIYTRGGNEGEVRMRRSTDGGLTFGSEIIPFPAGAADTAVNVFAPRISGLSSWLEGSLQPRILTDPVRANTLYVISVDDPDNSYSFTGDPSDIVIARSTDNGANWTRSTISHGPAGTIQIMPAAAIDAAGNITVTWYDNRRGLVNAAGDWLLDLYTTSSFDGGATFGNDFRINDVPFDPELGARDRFAPNGDLRIGEYNGVASAGGNAYAVWTGNSSSGQQIVFDTFAIGFQAFDSTPGPQQVVATPPTDFVIRLTEPVSPASAQPGSLLVNGVAANSLLLNAAGDTITFHYNTSPVSTEGLQQMALAAGALARQSDAASFLAFTNTFYYDALPLAVTATSPPATGGSFNLPAPLTLDVNFSEAVAPASVQATDLVLSGMLDASVTGVSLINGDMTARFTLGGITSEGTLTANIAAGAIVNLAGVPVAPFTASYQVDVTTAPFPSLLAPQLPLGSLVYSTSVSGMVNVAGDTDSLTLAVDAGQSVTVVVTADSPGLQPTVQVLSPSNIVVGGGSATAAGRNVLVQSVVDSTGGNYVVTVSGFLATTGNYTLRVYLNAAVEAADVGIGAHSTQATAQDLNSSFTSLSATHPSSARAAVIGSITGAPVTLSAIDSGWWTDQGFHTSNNKNYYVGQEDGILIHDYFVFDLSAVRQPITTAQLTLSNPSFVSPDATETYSLFNVTTRVPAVKATGSGQSGTIFDDLGTGTTLATQTVSATNPAQITFNAAGLSYLSAGEGNPIAVGGALTSISGTADQFVFGTTSGSTTKDLTLGVANTDVYSFSLAAGQTASVGLKHLTGSGSTITIQDFGGSTLASGLAQGGGVNLDLAIDNFVAPTAGTYYVVVTGSANATYNLVVTQDTSFDREANDSFAAAQPLGASAGAVGDVLDTLSQNVVPAALATTVGNGGNGYPFNLVGDGSPSMRYQQLYAHTEFGQKGAITAIRLRRSSGQAAFAASGLNVKINLGYSATTFDNPSSTFANNVGPGATTVFDGSLSLSSSGTGSPRPFDIVIPLTTPFFYDPGQGDLLLDVFARNPVATGQLDSSSSGQQSTTRRVWAQNVNASTGTVDSSFQGLVTRFDMLPDAAPGEDWYSLDVTSTASTLSLQTSTPADGANHFSNALNPHIELYDPAGMLVDAGVVLADGRNERIQFQPLVTGEYRFRVTSENNTSGEYFLAKNFSPVASGSELATLEDTTLPVTLAASDPENDPLSFTIVDSPLHGSVSGTGANRTYTPAQDYFGPDSFTYKASDGGLDSATALVSINMTPVNDRPAFVKGDDVPATDEDGPRLIDAWAKSFSAGAGEEGLQKVQFAVQANSNPALFAAQPLFDADGKLTFKPKPNVSGVAHITIVLADDGGTANGGSNTSDPQTFDIVITKPHPWHNTLHGIDVDGDGTLAPIDALSVVNYLNAPKPAGSGDVPANAQVGPPYYDVDNDEIIAPIDALTVINNLNAHTVLLNGDY